MNDDFMGGLRKDPPEKFTKNLRERLAAEHGNEDDYAAPAGLARFYRPAMILAAAAGLVIALTVSPALRASAQAFLDLFRVRTFAAVTVDPSRMERLKDSKLDMKSIIGDQVQEMEKAGPPRMFIDASAAGQAAGMTMRLPASIPAGFKQDTIAVTGRESARFIANTRKLREALDALGLSDVPLPAGLDGAQATVHLSPGVAVQYRSSDRHIVLLQAPSPQVDLPHGVDLSQLGEVGLRIAGLSASEAHRFATTIDWRSTLLVPVPLNASSFRDVDVQGHRALLVTTNGDSAPRSGEHRLRRGSMVMWTEGDKVFALSGNIPAEDLLLMANSLQ